MAVQLQPLAAAAVRATGIAPAWIHPGVYRGQSAPECSERHHPADVIPRAWATHTRKAHGNTPALSGIRGSLREIPESPELLTPLGE